MRIVYVPDTSRIVVWLWLRRIKKSEDSTAISADIIINNPPLLIFSLMFVVWLIVLIERVVDALFEDLIRVLWAMWTLRPWFCI